MKRVAVLVLAVAPAAAVACGGRLSSEGSTFCSGATCDDDPTTSEPTPVGPSPRPTSSPSPPRPWLPPPIDASTLPPLPPPPPPDLPPGAWRQYPFSMSDATTSGCTGGTRYVRATKFGMWVGVELCWSTRYKIYLSDSAAGTFYPIADGAGGGEDHCELVNPNLVMGPSDSSWAGSNCPSCANEMAWDHPTGALVYTRSFFGDYFNLEAWPQYNLYTSRWYECGVAIP
ncbi:MAG: hypothetical protein KIT84_14400 [Labilithrix sp.]|nr:hypothetical protein [Labilithrix sp.]MCW5812212.1 hypothetical protein [Labilithrix sp.]